MKQFTRIIGVDGVPNFGQIVDGIYRGGQPTEQGFRTLSDMEFKTVLNLRTHNDIDTEFCDLYGIIRHNYPLNVFENIKIEEFDEVLDIINKSEKPLFLHCLKGQDRTGVISACYRVTCCGWTLNEAIEEMEAYGHNNIWFTMLKSLRYYAMMKIL